MGWLRDLWDNIVDSVKGFLEWVKEYEKIILIVAGSLAGLGLILFLIFGVACRGYNPDPEAIKIGVTSQDFVLSNYEDVAELLADKGFTNIKTMQVQGYFFTTSGNISKISIDGMENFCTFSKFSPDAPIIINYYK